MTGAAPPRRAILNLKIGGGPTFISCAVVPPHVMTDFDQSSIRGFGVYNAGTGCLIEKLGAGPADSNVFGSREEAETHRQDLCENVVNGEGDHLDVVAVVDVDAVDLLEDRLPDPVTVGYECVDGNGVNVNHFAVHPDERGEGYGTDAMETVIEYFRTVGKDYLTVNMGTGGREPEKVAGWLSELGFEVNESLHGHVTATYEFE